MWNEIAREISQTSQEKFELEDRRSVSGGCINQAYKLIGNGRSYFVKINQASREPMFASEAYSLREILAKETIRVPKPICWGMADNSSYLVLEWLEFGSGNPHAWEEMGRQLAALHRAGGASQFGWEGNNNIGSTPQINTWTANWADFFAEHRIGYQLQLAKRKGNYFPDYIDVVAAVKEGLADRNPQPSLVHGDLWSGNAAITTSGEPVILDPASYYADREVDIAMTELFGGFPGSFYRGYEQVWDLDSGYQERKTIYNLYHILNHFNLFGGGYASQASRAIAHIMN